MNNTLKVIISPSPLSSNPHMRVGWGNGYVFLPEGHPLHGIGRGDIDDKIDAHGGFTLTEEVDERFVSLFAGLDDSDIGSWMVGFDTCHWGDTPERWPESAVLMEAERIRDAIMEQYPFALPNPYSAMNTHPHLFPAKAVAVITHSGVPIHVQGMWNAQKGYFDVNSYAINGQEVGFLLVDIVGYRSIESKAALALNATRPTPQECIELTYDYLDLTGYASDNARCTFGAIGRAIEKGHDRALRGDSQPSSVYLGLERDAQTGHWRWAACGVEEEITINN